MKKIYITLATLFLLAVSTFAVLIFGNSQWNKWIYVWQCYVYSPYDNVRLGKVKYIDMPDGFNGIWKMWYQNGKPYQEYYVGDNGYSRLVLSYGVDGCVVECVEWNEKEPHLWPSKMYYSNGGLKRKYFMSKQFGCWASMEYNITGELTKVTLISHGTKGAHGSSAVLFDVSYSDDAKHAEAYRKMFTE